MGLGALSKLFTKSATLTRALRDGRVIKSYQQGGKSIMEISKDGHTFFKRTKDIAKLQVGDKRVVTKNIINESKGFPDSTYTHIVREKTDRVYDQAGKWLGSRKQYQEGGFDSLLNPKGKYEYCVTYGDRYVTKTTPDKTISKILEPKFNFEYVTTSGYPDPLGVLCRLKA